MSWLTSAAYVAFMLILQYAAVSIAANAVFKRSSKAAVGLVIVLSLVCSGVALWCYVLASMDMPGRLNWELGGLVVQMDVGGAGASVFKLYGHTPLLFALLPVLGIYLGSTARRRSVGLLGRAPREQ
jgi:hypothetical protein